MKILHWNCQGLGGDLTIPHLKDIRRSQNPDVILLVETKHVNSYVRQVAKELGYQNTFFVPAHGSSGGAAVFWNERVRISLLDNPTLYCTNMRVEDGTNTFWMSYIYGNPVAKYRNEQWNDLIQSEIAGYLRNKPRLLIGDFNDIRTIKEKKGGITRSNASCSLFNKLLSVLGVHDIKTLGGRFTWMGRRSKYTIMSRIDRTLANDDWMELYPSATVSLFPWIGSDHRPLLLNTEGFKWKRSKAFRYDSRWRLYPELKKVMEHTWSQGCSNISEGDILSIIKKCRGALAQWRSQQNTNSGKLIAQLKQQIQSLYSAPSIDYTQLELLKIQLQLQYRLEEEYWRTKSRILWLQAGDKNTKYFHSKTKQRRHINRITCLQDDQGKLFSTAKDIRKHVEHYFRSLYTSNGCTLDSNLLKGIPSTVTEEINSNITAPVTEREIKSAVFAMDPDKSPGPDGMTPAFYQQHWDIIKTGVISFVQLFFQHNRLDPRINETHICLIPKVENPVSIKDYRPISLANVAYKIISKVLAERLKPWLHRIVSDNQSAFIPERLITDNVLVAHELMHSLHTKNLRNKFMALKLDIAKAFDKIEWQFIDRVMEQMGFCWQWRHWIKLCISTVSYSVLINGEPTQSIKPQRGLRQGDPISPYLYILCTEGLSRLIKQNIQEKKIHGFKASRSGPAISHLLFADDSLVFCKATDEESQNMLHLLNIYQRASGQEINYKKSSIAFSKGTPSQLQENIAKKFGITKVGGFGKYLGLPDHIGRKRKEVFNYLVQRIKNKLDGWYSKFLSPAGKEVLLKAVITSLPTYTMSCFLLPKLLLKEMTKAMRQFWWSVHKDRHGIPWIAWDKITLSKKEGGLGIRDMLAFNKALLAKQAWRLITKPSSLLARVYKAKYYRKTSFMEARSYQSSSYAWRSIIQTQPLIKKGMKWIVGDGQQIRVWKDNWLPDKENVASKNSQHIHHPDLIVKDLFLSGTTIWDLNKIRSIIHEDDVSRILKIRPSFTGHPDVITWTPSKSGSYTVKTGYHMQRAMDREEQDNQVSISSDLQIQPRILNRFWNLKIPPKIKIFWWKLIHNALPVADNLVKRRCRLDNGCQVCGEEIENIKHMILDCRVAKEIWSLSMLNKLPHLDQYSTVHQFIEALVEQCVSEQEFTLPFFLGWRIWKMRNKIIFENKRDHIVQVIRAAWMDKRLWEEAIQLIPTNAQTTQAPPSSISQIFPQGMEMYCIVDASWKSPVDKAGIGWSLSSKEGILKLQGSSAIDATTSPLVAEAMAILLAVQQLNCLGYKKVVILGDSLQLLKNLEQSRTVEGRKDININEATPIIEDILNLSRSNNFCFKWVPRNLVNYVDRLAKRVRDSSQEYIVTWL